MCRHGVGPCLAERAEAGLAAADGRQRVQQVAGGARQPIEPRHHQHVARRGDGDDFAKLRPISLGATRPLPEQLASPGRVGAARGAG